jgi:hypothetical protein
MGVTVTDKSSLCFSCHYGNRIISGKGSSFLQCQKYFEDPEYPKYPALPVITCSGYKVSVPGKGQRRLLRNIVLGVGGLILLMEILAILGLEIASPFQLWRQRTSNA